MYTAILWLGRGIVIIVALLVVALLSLMLLPLQLWNMPRTYRLLERFESAKHRVRGQWVTAQKLKRLSGMSESDIRILMSHDRVLDDFVVRRREYVVCERIKHIIDRRIPKLNRLPTISTVEYYEFRYVPRGKLQRLSWTKAFQVSVPSVRV